MIRSHAADTVCNDLLWTEVYCFIAFSIPFFSAHTAGLNGRGFFAMGKKRARTGHEKSPTESYLLSRLIEKGKRDLPFGMFQELTYAFYMEIMPLYCISQLLYLCSKLYSSVSWNSLELGEGYGQSLVYLSAGYMIWQWDGSTFILVPLCGYTDFNWRLLG